MEGVPFDSIVSLRKKFVIKIALENPVLRTGMKDAPAEGRKKTNQMLKQVQHDMRVWF